MRALPALVGVLVLAGCIHAPPADPPRTGDDAEPDAARLLALARAQVEHANGTTRYRVPGTPGSAEVAEWIAAELRVAGATARFDPFNATYRCDGTVAMRNVVGTLPGDGPTIYLAAHYDTRPVADKDPDPARRSLPVPGANDGASGVAVVLELARLLGNLTPRRHAYTFLFFDGEDGGAGRQGDGCDGAWVLGSTHYAQAMPAAEAERAQALVLFDLVGDKDLQLRKEGYTANGRGAATQDRIWAIAQDLGYGSTFRNERSYEILDDHKPFLDRGLTAVDVIHLDGGADPFPPSHHTTFDDLDHLSAESLRLVAEVAWAWVLEQER